MSDAATHSQAFGTASETPAAASLRADNDEHSSVDQAAGPSSALAIEVLHGRIGCAVFLDQDQQLLLCEDLPCAFAYNDQGAVSSARDTQVLPGTDEHDRAAGDAVGDVPAYRDTSSGYVGVCE